MNKILKSITLVVLVLSACNENQEIQRELDFTKYEKLSKTLETDFNQIAFQLNENNEIISTESVLNAVKIQYGKKSNKFIVFEKSFNSTSSPNQLNNFQKESIEQITSFTKSSSSLSELQLFLDEKFEYYSNQPIKIENKDFILSYITLLKSSLTFLDRNKNLLNADYLVNNSRTNGWWNNWGKCLAGIIGGAGIVVATGGTTTAAVFAALSASAGFC